MHPVILPATDPADTTFGTPPPALPVLHFPGLVWYNPEVRLQAVRQLREEHPSPVTLIGFSKSGIGAWNLTREYPGLVEATVIFDAPMTMEALPPWGTAPFYANDEQWQKDLPLRNLDAFQEAVPAAHPLILISGETFHDQMCRMSEALHKKGREHVFLPRPQMAHHWESGWLEEGLSPLLPPAGDSD